jgi:FkbM family methyltransferase
MPNDKALEALSRIAETADWRAAFVRELIAFEHAIHAPGVDVREEITGPLVDALFDDDQVIRKTLSSGVTFEFLYRSKIARDFVMSEPEAPDHAWEPQTSRILVNLAKGAQQVVIGGAYFGDHAILIAREIAAAGGVVHAFEPNDEQRAMLTRNAELNGLSNIRPRPEGLWSDSSTSLKLVGYDSFATAEVAEAGSDDGFQTVTIADYLKAAGGWTSSCSISRARSWARCRAPCRSSTSRRARRPTSSSRCTATMWTGRTACRRRRSSACSPTAAIRSMRCATSTPTTTWRAGPSS